MNNTLVLKYRTRKPKMLECSSTVNGMTDQPSLTDISRNVAALRNANGWTQGELATKAGLSQKVISNLENAEEKGIAPTFHTLVSVAKALRISLWVLMLPIPLEKLLETQKEPKYGEVLGLYLGLRAQGQATVERVLELEAASAPRSLITHKQAQQQCPNHIHEPPGHYGK